MKKLLIGYAATTLLGLLWLSFIVVTGLRGSGLVGVGYLIALVPLLPEAAVVGGTINVESFLGLITGQHRSSRLDVYIFLSGMTLKFAISYGMASFILFLWNRK